jgi:hypothetical protein
VSTISTSLDAMASGGKRVKVHDAQTVIKLPSAVKDLVSEIAGNREVSDSLIWREAMAEYLTKRGYNR